MRILNLIGLLLSLSMFPLVVSAKEQDFVCGTIFEEPLSKVSTKSKTLPNSDGQFITANGTLRMLIVFAEFEDKSEPSGPDYWF